MKPEQKHRGGAPNFKNEFPQPVIVNPNQEYETKKKGRTETEFYSAIILDSVAARLQLCSLAILPSHTPCQLLRAYQHKAVLDLIFQIHTVVMRISRCRPWLTCRRCAHSLRQRIARRSARLLDRVQRLLYLRIIACYIFTVRRYWTCRLQASQQESIKARLDCAILALHNEQSR